MYYKIRRNIFETSSSSANALAVIADRSKRKRVELTEPFILAKTGFYHNCDGAPHYYLTDWRTKMSYWAEDTKIWHDMFKKYTGQDFIMYELWAKDEWRDQMGKCESGFPCESELTLDIREHGDLYYDGYLCGRNLRIEESQYIMVPSSKISDTERYDIFGSKYGLESGWELAGCSDYIPAQEVGYQYPHRWREFGKSDMEFMAELIFNEGIGINIGGDCYCDDYWIGVKGRSLRGDIPDEDVNPFMRAIYSHVIGSSENGNEFLIYARNGTKIRICNGKEPNPEYPESIDMKITDICYMNCEFCYEKSSENGSFGSIDYPFLKTVPKFTEIALGGGNPLLHPELMKLLTLTDTVNITVHATDFIALYYSPDSELWDYGSELENYKRVGAFGISVTDTDSASGIASIINTAEYDRFDQNTVCRGMAYISEKFDAATDFVIHVINGVVTEEILKPLYDLEFKLLILGYKTKGRGVEYQQTHNVEENQKWLYDNIEEVCRHFAVVAFDNLALEQLEIKRFVSDEDWEHNFMGDEGTYSMYIDLVKGEYGISSTDERRWKVTENIRDMFGHVRKVVKEDQGL